MNIVYLFGAGASANPNFYSKKESVIPVVEHFNDKLINWLENEFPSNARSITKMSFADQMPKVEVLREEFLDRIPRFVDDLRRHYSIDTLARKYYVKNGQNSDELRFLKICLSSFLFWRQHEVGLDPRYDLFLSAIGDRDEDNSGLVLRSNVKIISWNYDNQFELSFSEFAASTDYYDTKRKLQMFPPMKGKNQEFPNFDSEKFGIIKVNGSSEIIATTEGDYDVKLNVSKNKISTILDYNRDLMTSRFNGQAKSLLSERILFLYHLVMNWSRFNEQLLTFSWEDSVNLSPLRGSLKSACCDTDVLVVIGYSFPTFNRKLDKEIFKHLGGLEKIYVQTRPENFAETESKIMALRENGNSVRIELVPQLSEFYIPYEIDTPKPYISPMVSSR